MRMVVRIPAPTDQLDLARLSEQNPGVQIERDAEGNIVMSPTKGRSGAKSLEAAHQLYLYAKRAGGTAFDSSQGFEIGPNGAVRSPDASWVSGSREAALGDAEKEEFWPLSPDVVIEVRSKTDRWATVVAKLDEYIARGSSYAVAVDPDTREVVERGQPPAGLALDFDAIVDA